MASAESAASSAASKCFAAACSSALREKRVDGRFPVAGAHGLVGGGTHRVGAGHGGGVCSRAFRLARGLEDLRDLLLSARRFVTPPGGQVSRDTPGQGIDVLGLERERALVRREGVFRMAEAQLDATDGDVRQGAIRRDIGRGLVVRKRLGVAALGRLLVPQLQGLAVTGVDVIHL